MEPPRSLPLVEQREKTMGQFTAFFARCLPEDLKFVAFTGPASFREPEIDDCWHPYHIECGFGYFLFTQIIPFVRAFSGGVKRIIMGKFGRFTFLEKTDSTFLGITPLSICSIVDNQVRTKYCHPEDAANFNWLIINDTGREEYEISRLQICLACFVLMSVWLRVSFLNQKAKNIDWLTAAVITLRWIANLQWVTLWMLDRKVQQFFNKNKITKVFCVHEMWPWARAIWRTAYRNQISTVTFQHASITRTKFWYFPTEEELASGLQVPDEFFVFSSKEVALLTPHYPATRFVIACGPRYAHWQQKILSDYRKPSATAPIIFVTSVPWWDNDAVLKGIMNFIHIGCSRPIRVRLHPLAVISSRWQRWISRMVHQGKLIVSTIPLSDDVLHAAAVVGMNSTIIEEAIAMGRTAIVLSVDGYLSFNTQLGDHVSLSEFNPEYVERCIMKHGSVIQGSIIQGRTALGLDHAVARIAI